MQFPIYQVPFLGNGMTIALDAVIHVIYSHGVAIGLFALIAFSEYRGWRTQSAAWERFAHDALGMVVLFITSVGAITGVGIWFVISTLEPRGTGAMLRVFFWPWFLEWFVFFGEVVILLIYYFTWDRWTGERKRRHVALGFSYTAFAVVSGFLITGILGFMMTPDTWPWSGSFWPAFFNPSFPPQLLLRLGAAATMGAVFASAFLVMGRREAGFRREALPIFGRVAIVALAITALATWWYFQVVPDTFKTHAVFSVVTSYFSQVPAIFWIGNALGVLLLLSLALAGLARRVTLARLLVVPAIIACVAFVSEYERIREFIRGPYVMPGYMYANQVLLKEVPFYDDAGMLDNSYWYNAVSASRGEDAQGAYLFGQNCSVCHTIGGLNSITDKLQGRTADSILVLVRHTQQMVPFMPPFAGTPDEEVALARYLYRLASGQTQPVSSSRFMPGQ